MFRGLPTCLVYGYQLDNSVGWLDNSNTATDYTPYTQTQLSTTHPTTLDTNMATDYPPTHIEHTHIIAFSLSV